MFKEYVTVELSKNALEKKIEAKRQTQEELVKIGMKKKPSEEKRNSTNPFLPVLPVQFNST